jgi:hypothetical protein
MDPVADARALVAERLPDAVAAYLGSGVLSGRRTTTSDLDIVVVVDSPPAPFRQSLRWREWPAELFVHDHVSLPEFFARDAGRRRPTLARMVADGVTLTDRDGTAVLYQDQARAVLTAGPPVLTVSELELCRYGLTDLLDDLAGSADDGEIAVISWTLWRQTAELALLLAGSWLGTGKWLLRELRAGDPELAAELVASIGNPERLTAAADQVLGRAGGRLWAGYRVSAPPGDSSLSAGAAVRSASYVWPTRSAP